MDMVLENSAEVRRVNMSGDTSGSADASEYPHERLE
jgi:hypothetical protein